MTESTKHRPIRIDLNQFKLHIDLKRRFEITLCFDSPSRRFYLSVIALIVNEMKRLGKITSIPLEEHHDLLALLNESVGGSAGSSKKGNLQSRIYRKWKDALPNLEQAPLFKVLGRHKKYDEAGSMAYSFTEAEKDSWANLFEYTGSEDKVRLKFAIDKIATRLDDVAILYEDSINGDAWEKFLSGLQKKKVEDVSGTKAIQPISEAPEPPVSPPREERRGLLQSRYHWIALIAVVVAIVGAAAWGIWELAFRPAQVNKASIERMAFPLPDVPSIVVLPFVNMSEDPNQEFLSDAITENIITALSKVPRFFVIARNSAFAYKGKQVKVKQVSEELGVRYVLEGGVQRTSDRIRVTAQLIDALNGLHIWAERYDRNIEDIFALQDEITMKILTAAQVKLTGMGTDEAISYEKSFKGKQGLDCYLKYWEAIGIQNRFTAEGNKEIRRIGEEVTSMCPDSPDGYFLLALAHSNDSWITPSTREESLDKGIELMQKALAIDDTNGLSHALLGQLYTLKGEYDKGIAEGERAVALNPGGAATLHCYALNLNLAGRYEEAIAVMQKVIRLDPVGYASYYNQLGKAFLYSGRLEEAVSTYKKLIKLAPDMRGAHLELAVAYVMLGREEEARAEIAEVRRINPKFSVDFFTKMVPLKDQSKIDEMANALRKAGLE